MTFLPCQDQTEVLREKEGNKREKGKGKGRMEREMEEGKGKSEGRRQKMEKKKALHIVLNNVRERRLTLALAVTS